MLDSAMHKLAFYTVGLMHEDVSSERSKGFVDRAPGVYAVADKSDGFDSRSIRDPGQVTRWRVAKPGLWVRLFDQWATINGIRGHRNDLCTGH